MALQQINGFTRIRQLAISLLPTLPPDCEVVKITDNGLAWKYGRSDINYVEDQDVHVLNKEMSNV